MASLIQHVATETAASQATVTATPASTAARSLLLVGLVNTGTLSVTSVTDNKGNTYLPIPGSAFAGTANDKGELWFCRQAIAGVTSVVGTFSVADTSFKCIWVMEVGGIDNAVLGAVTALTNQTGSGTTDNGATLGVNSRVRFMAGLLTTSGGIATNPKAGNEFTSGGDIQATTGNAMCSLLTTTDGTHQPVWLDGASGATYGTATVAFYEMGHLGTAWGGSQHPGQSPGNAPASLRFWQPQQASTATVSTDVTLALSGVSTTTGRGSVGVQHTNALTGVSETSAVGTVKANTTKALSGVQTATSVGSLGVQRTKALAGVSTVTAIGTLASSRTVPLTGRSATGSVGNVTVQSADITVALSGVQTVGQVGTLTPSGGDEAVGIVSKTRHVIYVGRRHRYKSSHRELDELLERVFAPVPDPAIPPALIEQIQEIVQPFVSPRNELNLAKLYRDMDAVREVFRAWRAEIGQQEDNREDDDESFLLMN